MQFDEVQAKNGEVGFVQRVTGSVIEIEGLPGVKLGEMIFFESGERGVVTALAESGIECLILARSNVDVCTKAARLGETLRINVGPEILGGAIDVLGNKFGKKTNAMGVGMELDATPMGIVHRAKITKPFFTGIIISDLMIPIGRGQRELVMGDRKTGKSSFLLQTILAQARMGTVCVYAAIGKKRAEIMRTLDFFAKQNVLEKIVVVAASSHDGPGEIYLAPYTAMTVAEYFRNEGQEVLVVLDDMSTHAKFYRQLSLISKKFPGRDSYPGDIFHIHSKLLERAGNFVLSDGREVAITCLPVVETMQGDITGYIQTNMMSMTDGHIYFDNELFFKGRRPAINPFVSVTRVGYQTQNKLARQLSRALFELLNNYERTQGFLRFGAELGENSRQILVVGDKVLNFFDQPYYLVVPSNLQLVALSAIMAGVWDGRGIGELVEKYETKQDVRAQIDRLATEPESLEKLYVELRNVWKEKI